MFQQCPWTKAETARCLYSLTTSGEFVLGSKKAPIGNPVTQAGYTTPVSKFSKLVAATNGITLSKTPQPIPGGLAGFVNCKEISNFTSHQLRSDLRKRPDRGQLDAGTGKASQRSPAQRNPPCRRRRNRPEDAGQVRLENPFLGESCYIGSSSSPVMLGTDHRHDRPAGPNKPISGSAGGT